MNECIGVGQWSGTQWRVGMQRCVWCGVCGVCVCVWCVMDVAVVWWVWQRCGGCRSAVAAVHCGGYSCWPLQQSGRSSASSVSRVHQCSGPPLPPLQCLATQQHPEVQYMSPHHHSHTLSSLHKSPGAATNESGCASGCIQCELTKSPGTATNESGCP